MYFEKIYKLKIFKIDFLAYEDKIKDLIATIIALYNDQRVVPQLAHRAE